MNARKENKDMQATTEEKDEAEYFEVKLDQIRISIKQSSENYSKCTEL